MQKNRRRESFATTLRDLADQGSQVDLSVADSVDGQVDVEIVQVGGIYESRIFELSSGLTGYMLDIDITNQTNKIIYGHELQLCLPWEDSRFDWMLDPRQSGEPDLYRFPGKNSLELPRAEVINHVVMAPKGVKPLCPLRGWLLATGGPMPTRLRHGDWIDATLALIASKHARYTATIRVWVDRLENVSRRPVTKSNLFEPVEHNTGSPVVARGEKSIANDSGDDPAEIKQFVPPNVVREQEVGRWKK